MARPLARSLAPLTEESLPGLILRLAHRLERSPARIAELCGLSSHQNRLPAHYLIAMPDDLTQAFAVSSHLHTDEVRTLTLSSSFASAYPPLGSVRLDGSRNTAAARKMWAAGLSSRYCPTCLAGDGSAVQNLFGGPWKLRWHLPVSFACTTHHRLLAHSCPQCDGTPNQPANTERQGLIMQRTTSGLHPAQCRHLATGDGAGQRRPVAVCAARLDHPQAAAILPGSDLRQLIALQARIDRHLLPGPHSLTVPGPGPDPSFFPDLIAAAQLIRLAWPDSARFAPSAPLADLIDRHLVSAAEQRAALAPGQHARHTWAAPTDPVECGALLVTADSLLGENTSDDPGLVERVQPLAVAAFTRHPANIGAALRRMDFSSHLARALAPRLNGFYRAGGHRPAVCVPSRHSSFSIDHVPALLPEEWLLAHFGSLLTDWKDPTRWQSRHLRRVAVLKLAEMSSGNTWPECAQTLHIPWNSAEQSFKVLKQQLTPRHLWPAFDHAVAEVAGRLDSPAHRVNYAQRRDFLATWQIPAANWEELRHDLDALGQEYTSPTPKTATALIWAHVTEGDYLHSPALQSLRRSGHSTRQLVASIGQLCTPANCKGSKRELLRRLNQYAVGLAAVCDHPQTSP